MATYNIQKEITITRQEGDDSDLTINVPAILDLTGATARLQIRSVTDKLILSRDITPTGQTLYTQFTPQDFLGKPGTHRWELEVLIQGKRYTIGRGNFEIIKQTVRWNQ